MKSDAINELATALSLVQGELQDVRKDNAVTDYSGKAKYKYADLGQVLAEVRPLLAKHGLSICQMPGRLVDGEIPLETMLMHSSGQWISTISSAAIEQVFTKEGKAVTTQAQAVGSVISYLRRYCISAMVGLAQIDDDAQQNNGERHQTPVVGPRTPVLKTTATQVATEPKPEQNASQTPTAKGMTPATKKRVLAVAGNVWPPEEVNTRLEDTLRRIGLPLHAASLTEEQGLQLLGAIEVEEAGL